MTTETATRRYSANPAKPQPGTLVDLFFRSVDRHNRSDAQLYRTEKGWQSISHQQLQDDVRALADGLTQLGLQRSDRVALLSENRPEWALADYALLTAGVLNVPLYPTLPGNQLAFILNDCGARAIFVSNAEQLAKIRACRPDLTTLEYIIVFDSLALSGSSELALASLLERGRAQPSTRDMNEFRARAQQAQPDDVATIIYTSGTTGQPKGVLLTHNNIFSNVLAQDWLNAEPGEPFVTVSFLPLSHIFQRMVDYCLFWLGCTIAYASVDTAVKAFAEVRPTLVVAVPRVYEKIYANILGATGIKRKLVLWARQIALDWAEAKLAGRNTNAALAFKHRIADKLVFRKVRAVLGGRLSFFVSGGAPLPAQIARFFYGAGVLILEGYGLTETSPVLTANTLQAFRFGTVGRPVPGTEIAIADDGEILARGPQIMKGYYNNPAATAEAIDVDGWFHTGDVGEIDRDGFLRITDRKKELIVTAGGKNIAPQPIQNQAKLSRFIADALLIGDKRPYPILLVVPDFLNLETWARQQQLSWESRAELVALPAVHAKIEEEVKRRLEGFARYELPKKILLLPREFELERGEITPKLSVRRKVVEEHFRQGIEALYRTAQAGGDTP